MLEYAKLKRFLLSRTQRYGAFITLYCLLVASPKAAVCAALGAAGSYAYLAWLCHNIDAVTGDDDVPMVHANSMEPGLLRFAARVAAGLRQQAQPRLLVRRCRYPMSLCSAV